MPLDSTPTIEDEVWTKPYDQYYQPQIDALMNEDWDEFKRLVGSNDGVEDLYDAWGNTGDCPNSLFAYLPNSDDSCCASQVERSLDDWPFKVYYQNLFGFQEQGDRITLTDFSRAHLFSKEKILLHLEEFARRQTLANTYPFSSAVSGTQ